MDVPSDTCDGECFSIGIQARLKHGDLMQQVERFGSQSALANHLGVSSSELSAWCRLQRCPPTCTEEIHSRSHWTAAQLRELERRLFDLTGKTLDTLFPPTLRRNREFLEASKTIAAIKDIELRALSDATQDRLTLPSPDEVFAAAELRELVAKRLGDALKALSGREQEIIKLRFGLGGGQPHTLREVGGALGIGPERVRQVEALAIRKLRDECPREVLSDG